MPRRGLLRTIDELTSENRRLRDPEIEARLISLRRDAGVHAELARPARAWPQRVKDRFPETDGIPEIEPGQLSPRLLRSAVFTHGCLLVRGFVGPTDVDRLTSDIDMAFAAYDDHAGGAPVSETAPWYVPFEPAAPFHDSFIPRPWLREAGGVLAVDSPRAFFDVVDTFSRLRLPKLVMRYFGERPMLLAKKCTLRRQTVAESNPDWHQDGAFMGRDIRAVNVWVPLSRCGVDAPSLDIVARRYDDIVPPGTDGAAYEWSVGDALVDRSVSDDIVRPDFEPGDALLFDHMLLHRTALSPVTTRPRHAI
jgi:hypothetical protein